MVSNVVSLRERGDHDARVIVAAVLAGFAVRFVAMVLREIIYERREEGGPDTSM